MITTVKSSFSSYFSFQPQCWAFILSNPVLFTVPIISKIKTSFEELKLIEKRSIEIISIEEKEEKKSFDLIVEKKFSMNKINVKFPLKVDNGGGK